MENSKKKDSDDAMENDESWNGLIVDRSRAVEEKKEKKIDILKIIMYFAYIVYQNDDDEIPYPVIQDEERYILYHIQSLLFLFYQTYQEEMRAIFSARNRDDDKIFRLLWFFPYNNSHHCWQIKSKILEADSKWKNIISMFAYLYTILSVTSFSKDKDRWKVACISLFQILSDGEIGDWLENNGGLQEIREISLHTLSE